MFQFPSNGKAYPKERKMTPSPKMMAKFQFPSNGKAYPKLPGDFMAIESVFHVFQFPSNGKAYPKAETLHTS